MVCYLRRVSRSNRVLAGLAVVAIATAAWLYRDNRALRGQLAARPVPSPAAKAQPPRDGPAVAVGAAAAERRSLVPSFLRIGRERTPPKLEPPPKATRAARRARRQQKIRALLGRLDGETAAG